MKTDPTIDRIRKIRHEISKEYEHDPKKLIKYYIKHQQKHKKLIKTKMSIRDFPLNTLRNIHGNRLPMQKIFLKIR
jgi:hypothetical protein